MRKRSIIIFMFLALLMLPSFSYAGEADVEFVEATLVKGSYFFEVTVRHADEGWEHFANWYRIRTEDGREIARRVLAHPHVHEQPFTRELAAVKIPEDVKVIVIEGHDMIHEYGGKTIRMDLTKTGGEGYRVTISGQ